MTANQSPGFISNAARIISDIQTALEAMVLFAGEHLGAAAESTLVISGGAVTPPTNGGNLFSVDTAGGAGNLTSITNTNVPDGRLVLIRCANPSVNLVTVVTGSGITTTDATNVTFSSTKQWMLLKRTGSGFEEITRFGFSTGPKRFVGTAQTPALSTVLGPFTHSLGSAPTRAWLVFQCVTATNGYSVGDQLVYFPSAAATASSTGESPLVVFWTSTTVSVAFNGASSQINLVNKAGGTSGNMVYADWEFFIYAEN